ncbi:hypothetical protein [Candidatus Nitronereus thalassa]|uniref:Periplasmic protein n=1 Tax=Candidatus Nitronereus thalassa TaxID=3020898 RepID=A0ABU3KA31_9BACT|nr:hypothetical protein [Candidatus Nitronereus thalassa]MDT7043163.1 hypothetical protein [Candidatus Nitronereus thalassa]
MKKSRPEFHLPSFLGGALIASCVMLISIPAGAFETEPHPLDTFLTNILNFKEPTGIRGTLRYINLEETIVWLNWNERSDDRPLFQTKWQPVPGDATLAVHPQDLDQFHKLRQFSKGAPIEMIIQFDSEGKRRILSYHDLTQPPKIPM